MPDTPIPRLMAHRGCGSLAGADVEPGRLEITGNRPGTCSPGQDERGQPPHQPELGPRYGTAGSRGRRPRVDRRPIRRGGGIRRLRARTEIHHIPRTPRSRVVRPGSRRYSATSTIFGNRCDCPISPGIPSRVVSLLTTPLMRPSLGAPIRHLGEPVGNIYLTGKVGGEEFSEEDEETLVMFAPQPRSPSATPCDMKMSGGPGTNWRPRGVAWRRWWSHLRWVSLW